MSWYSFILLIRFSTVQYFIHNHTYWCSVPQKDDRSLMAQFYFADEELNLVAGELDSFDGRKDPERCTALVNQLRHCQDRVGIMKGNDVEEHLCCGEMM